MLSPPAQQCLLPKQIDAADRDSLKFRPASAQKLGPRPNDRARRGPISRKLQLGGAIFVRVDVRQGTGMITRRDALDLICRQHQVTVSAFSTRRGRCTCASAPPKIKIHGRPKINNRLILSLPWILISGGAWRSYISLSPR